MNPINPSGVPDPPPSSSSVWPPPPAGTTPYGHIEENTSGQNGSVPPEIAALKWNWGAALMTWLWCVNHKMLAYGIGILVLSFIPYVGSIVGLVALVYFGINGHKLAWQNRRFDGGLPQYFAVQTAWMNWGIGLALVGFVFGIVGAIFGAFAQYLHPGR